MSTTKRPSSSGERRRFDPAFKREAVELGRRIGIVQAAKDLGLSESGLRDWTKTVDRRGGDAFLPISQRADVDAELRRLREENRVLKMEREILKKATAFFAKGGP